MVAGAKEAADLVMKVGGAASLIGALIGAWMFADVDCTSTLDGKQCSNIFGEVDLNAVGQPNLVALGGIGLLVGAVAGGLLGWVASRLFAS